MTPNRLDYCVVSIVEPGFVDRRLGELCHGVPVQRRSADEASPPSDEPPGSGDPEIAANRERLQALRQQHYGVSDLGDLLRSPKWMFWTAVLVAVIVAGIVIRSSL